MDFLKDIFTNRKLILQLGKNDFKNRFANTSLGTIWGFLAPFIFMIMYVIVFQFIFVTPGPQGAPYVVWFMPGMAMWMCLNDGIIGASNSIRGYSYLVKKVVFPVDVIPVISLIANAFVALFLFLIATVTCIAFGFIPNVLQLLYIIVAAYAFIISFTRFTAAVATLVPDFSNLLGILMQLFFWFTPVVWNLTQIVAHQTITRVIKCSPFTYLVTGLRDAFMQSDIGNIVTQSHGLYTIIFWVITAVVFLWGNYIFKKSKKDFADVL